MPRGIPNSKIDAAAEKIGQDRPLDIPMEGSIEGLLRADAEQIQIVDGPSLGAYAAELAFNEEIVDVVVHESTEKNSSPLVEVYVNGTPQRFIRGLVQSVKRKYVEVLARAKETGIKTEVDMSNGNPVNRITRHTALRYPFSIQNDPSPKGRDWLRKVLASA